MAYSMNTEQLQAFHNQALHKYDIFDARPFHVLDIAPIAQMWQSAQPNIANARKGMGSINIADAELFEAMSRMREIGIKIEKSGRSNKKWDHLLRLAPRIKVIADFSA